MARHIFMAEAKQRVLFLFGLIGLVVSGAWFLRDHEYEPLIAFCSAIALLLVDFLWISDTRIPVKELRGKPNDELSTIARSLKIKRFSFMTKEELVKAIEDAQNSKHRPGNYWGATKWALTAGAILLTPLVTIILPKPEQVPPRYNLGWYEPTDSGLRLVDPFNIQLSIDPEDIFRNRIRVPIRLALRNADNAPLKVVRIELRYEKGLKVFSTGKAKIDQNGPALIYEHEIGTLEQVQEFTPIETIDTVTVPFLFFVVPVVALTGDDVPHYMVIVAGEDVAKKRQFTLDFRVFCDGRPPVQGQIRMAFAFEVHVVTDEYGSARMAPNNSDVQVYKEDAAEMEIIEHWQRPLPRSAKVIDYRMVRHRGGTRQLIRVNGVLRKVLIDRDSDGNLDLILSDGDGDGGPDYKFVFESPWPMVKWPREAAE